MPLGRGEGWNMNRSTGLFFFLVNLPITVRQPFIDMAYTQTNMLTQLTDRPTNR